MVNKYKIYCIIEKILLSIVLFDVIMTVLEILHAKPIFLQVDWIGSFYQFSLFVGYFVSLVVYVLLFGYNLHHIPEPVVLIIGIFINLGLYFMARRKKIKYQKNENSKK